MQRLRQLSKVRVGKQMKLNQLLEQIKLACQTVLQTKLTGVYVHGSIAFGCFRWQKSDVDFLVVTEEPLTQPEKEALIKRLLELDDQAPPKGLEMSVMLRTACRSFVHPAPYELHYSKAYRESYLADLSETCRRMQGVDPDLAAHVTVTRARGFALCGEPVEAVFAPVRPEDYLDSILSDVEDVVQGILRDPVYFTLNLCRVLAYVQEGLILSKEQGGEWACSRYPQERVFVEAALETYRYDQPVPDGMELEAFGLRMLACIASLDDSGKKD